MPGFTRGPGSERVKVDRAAAHAFESIGSVARVGIVRFTRCTIRRSDDSGGAQTHLVVPSSVANLSTITQGAASCLEQGLHLAQQTKRDSDEELAAFDC